MGEARIYEDIQDYEAAKSIFDEVKILTNAFYLFHSIIDFRFLRNIMNNILE